MAVYKLGDQTPKVPDDNSCYIAPNAVVLGQVEISSRVSIWFNAVLRGDNDLIKVGEGSNIQDGAVVHVDPGFPVTVGRNCTIGHASIIHGCSIGDRTLIGMGATILNGARIGKDCLVGANALVTEGKEFPDRSLIVGSPARAIRTLSDDDIANLKVSANSYAAKILLYQTELIEIKDRE